MVSQLKISMYIAPFSYKLYLCSLLAHSWSSINPLSLSKSPEKIIRRKVNHIYSHVLRLASPNNNFLHQAYQCDGFQNCENTDLDERNCEDDNTDISHETGIIEGDYYWCLFLLESKIDARVKISKTEVCDLKCNCVLCDDESDCNNITYGLRCDVKNKRGSKIIKKYIPANDFCDGNPTCFREAGDPLPAEDERYCEVERSVGTCVGFGGITRHLYPNQLCSVYAKEDIPTCLDGRDQLNCFDETRLALSCPVDGVENTVSLLGICRGYNLCDDGYDDDCLEAEGDCFVHKNLLCNGKFDCPAGGDEKVSACQRLFKTTCIRRNPYRGTEELRIPAKWVVDGVEDCVDGKDENIDAWDICGLEEDRVRYVDVGMPCEEVYLCKGSSGVMFVQFFELCDRINTCGREIDVCRESRSQTATWNRALEYSSGHKVLVHCLRGLNIWHKSEFECTFESPFRKHSQRAVDMSMTLLDKPVFPIDCTYVFGETLVYLSCSGLCKGMGCILPPIEWDMCANQPRALSFTPDKQVALIFNSGGNV